MVWRIQSSQTLQVKRYGVGVKEGFTHYSDGRIPTYTVAPDDILSVYPLPVMRPPASPMYWHGSRPAKEPSCLKQRPLTMALQP